MICEVKRCNRLHDVIWASHKVCNRCWEYHCNDKEPWDFYEEFNVKKEVAD